MEKILAKYLQVIPIHKYQAEGPYQPIARWKHLPRWQMVEPELESFDIFPLDYAVGIF